jgi:hypothetical protein
MQLLPCHASLGNKRFVLGDPDKCRSNFTALQRRSCKCLGVRKSVDLQQSDKKLGRVYQDELITPSIHNIQFLGDAAR